MFKYNPYIIDQLEGIASRIPKGESAVERAKMSGKIKVSQKYERALKELKRRYDYLNYAYMLQRHLPMLISDKDKVFTEVIKMRVLYFCTPGFTAEEYKAYRKRESELYNAEERHAILDACNVFGTYYDFSNHEKFLEDIQQLLIAIVMNVMDCLDGIFVIPRCCEERGKKKAC